MLKERIPLELNEEDAATLARLSAEAGISRTEVLRRLIRVENGRPTPELWTRVAVDPTIPQNELHMRDGKGRAVAKVVNLSFCEHGAAKGLCKHRGCK